LFPGLNQIKEPEVKNKTEKKRRSLMSEELTRIKNLLADLEEETLMSLIEERVAANEDPMAIVEACREGMEVVGKRFASQEYFVSDLIVSAELFNNIMKIIGPRLTAKSDSELGAKVVFGTVEGDIHDIGKNLVTAMLRCNGFEVYDVGINVPPQVFVDKVKETGARVVGLSGLLTVAYPSMAATIKALAEAGLRDKVKVMVGGGMMDDFVCQQVGADAWGRDAMEAVRLTKSFTGEKVK
jgi:methylmalonyl-CoA mutase cobalamin-binding domain/chain